MSEQQGWMPAEPIDTEAPAPDPSKVVTEPPSPTARRSTRRPGRSTRKPASGPRKPSKPRSAAPEPPSTVEAIQGVMQVPAAGLIIAGKRANSVPLIADGATVLVHGPALASALADLADNDPRVMALLEKVITFGPYGAFVTALVMMGAQFARNHGAPAELTTIAGAVSAEQIIEAAGLGTIETPAPSENGQGRSDSDSPNV